MKKIELTADQKEALESRHKKSCGKRKVLSTFYISCERNIAIVSEYILSLMVLDIISQK
ncbi:MAG: hypothetical protein ACJAZQ_002942 [Cognaticolwellia sp.]|jgi:hypothetical protein